MYGAFLDMYSFWNIDVHLSFMLYVLAVFLRFNNDLCSVKHSQLICVLSGWTVHSLMAFAFAPWVKVA